MKKVIYPILGIMLASATVACNDDHNPDWETQSPYAVTLESTSVADGATVSTAGGVIDFNFTSNVVLNPEVGLTLNDVVIPNNTHKVEVVNGRTLRVTLGALEENTSYTLAIPDRAVAGLGSMTFVSPVALHFTTSGAVLPEVSVGALSNANAIPQATKVYDFMIQNSGKKILSGAMANVSNNNDFAGWIKNVTGKDVAIICYDFIHLPSSGQNWIDYNDITPAVSQWEANGLVSYMWHWNVPNDEEAWRNGDVNNYGCRPPGYPEGGGTNFDIERALQEGTWEHEFILEDLAKVASVLKKLQERGIPVIWRPLHEAAGDYEYQNPWFWWGLKGGEATKQLWRLMYDQLVNVHGCNNLIWVWTAQYKAGYETNLAADYPGNDVVDMIGVDIYAKDDNSQKNAYNALLKLCDGKKLVTISETGLVQNPDKCIADGANWAYFNIWYTYNQHLSDSDTDGFGNTAESLKAVLESPYVINRDQMPSFK